MTVQLKLQLLTMICRPSQLQVLRVSRRRVLQVASVQLRQGEGGRLRLHVHMRLHQHLRSVPGILFVRGERRSHCAHFFWEHAVFVGIRLRGRSTVPGSPLPAVLTHFQARSSVRALLLVHFTTICQSDTMMKQISRQF